ncbi:hypothetical protein TeGR_g8994, partial [Tetraparma gracilis]
PPSPPVAASNKYVIHPKNPLKIRWDMFCGVLIVYSVIVIPWRIGFDVDSEGPFEVFDVGVDLMFALDMCLCFATGIYVEERLVTELPAIRNQYLSTWFLPDLLSTVPIDKVAGAFLGGGGGGATTYASDFVFRNASQLVEDDIAGGALASLGLIRILRLARLLKLMRLLKLSKKASGVDVNDLINPAIRKLLSVLGKIIFIAHLLSCMWFGVNECEPIKKLWPSSAELVVWDQATETAVYYKQDWGLCGHDTLFSQYLASFYWTIATMMAVGYGDVSPGTTDERLFGITTQVIGSMAFGLIIATVGIIVETVNPEATMRKRRLDELTAFLTERGVTKQLKRQVKEHFEHYFASKTVFDEPGILMDLPVSLKTQVVFESRRADLNNLKIFRTLDIVLVVDLVVKLKPMCLQFHQTMGYTGSCCAETYFVSKGKVQGLVTIPDKTDSTKSSMSICSLFKDGDDFEMDAMLSSQEMRCTYRAVSVTDLFWIESADFGDVIDEYPGCANKLRLYAEQHKVRMDGACESGTVTSDEVGGLVQQKVVYDGKLQKLEDVIQFFDSGKSGDLQVQKIRTYRMVPVDETIQAMGSNLGDGPSRAGSERSVRGKAYVEPMLPETPKSGNLSAGGGSPSPPGRLTSGKHSSFSQSFTAGSGGVAELGAGLTMGMLGKKMVQIEVEETTAELGKRWIINPKHPKKIFWDLFIGALILWSVIIVPFRLGFDQEPAAGSTMEYLDIFQDLMFGVDIALCFRLAYLDDQFVYVSEWRSIASNYFKMWFWIDFLSTFPIDRIIIALNSSGDESSGVMFGNSTMAMAAEGDNGNAARSLKMIKVLRLIRLSKLAKLLKLKNLVKGLDEILALSAVAMKFLQLIITLLFVGHLFGCFWNYTSSNFVSMYYSENETPDLWWDTTLLQDNPEAPSLDVTDVSQMYVTSMYWAFTTMTTCGYGDIVPMNDIERMYAVFIMIMGATIFGYIVGTVGALAVNANGAPARRHARVSMATNYLEEQNMPKKWSDMVTKQLIFFFDVKSPFNEDGGLLAMMPRELRREIILQSHREIIPQIPLFKRQSRDFVSTVLTKMRPHCISKGQQILHSIDGSDGVYFIMKGTAAMHLLTPAREKVNSIYIDAGRFFGHEIYVQEDLLCTVDGVAYEREYTAVNDCYLFVLLDIDIAGILESYPMIGSQLKLALHQMICSQPPIKPTQQRARKQRKSIRAFAFGSSRKIHPGLAAAGAGADQVGKTRKLNDDLDKEMEEMENEIEKRHLETQELAEKAHEKELQEKSVHIGGTPDRSAHKRPSEDSA